MQTPANPPGSCICMTHRAASVLHTSELTQNTFSNSAARSVQNVWTVAICHGESVRNDVWRDATSENGNPETNQSWPRWCRLQVKLFDASRNISCNPCARETSRFKTATLSPCIYNWNVFRLICSASVTTHPPPPPRGNCSAGSCGFGEKRREERQQTATDLCRSGWRRPWSARPRHAWWTGGPWAPAATRPSPPRRPGRSAPRSGWTVPEERSRRSRSAPEWLRCWSWRQTSGDGASLAYFICTSHIHKYWDNVPFLMLDTTVQLPPGPKNMLPLNKCLCKALTTREQRPTNRWIKHTNCGMLWRSGWRAKREDVLTQPAARETLQSSMFIIESHQIIYGICSLSSHDS